MSIKYCYNQEIHKTFNLPSDFPSLIKELTSLFVQELPANFLVQYQDDDGDKIAITGDQEYQALMKHELSTTKSMIKFFLASPSEVRMPDKRSTCTPRTTSNGSFEVVENENSLQMEEIEDSVHSDQENEEKVESRVVVSLQIPTLNLSKSEEKQEIEDEGEGEDEDEVQEEKEQSPSCSATGRSRTSDSKDLVKEMSLSSLSMDEENLSVSEKAARESPKKTREMKRKKMLTLEIPEFNENDSKDLLKHFSQLVEGKSVEPAQTEPVKAEAQVEEEANEHTEDKVREESPERWVSFSSHHEETPTLQDIELQGKSDFTRAQKSEVWFTWGQDMSYGPKESVQENEKSGELELKNIGSQEPDIEINYQELKQLGDTRQDIWYDLQCNPIQHDVSFEGYSPRKYQPEEENTQGNPENLNISLLSTSEANRIASAIGSISRINGVKKLRISPECNTPEISPAKIQPVSPIYNNDNNWTCKKIDLKTLEEEDWPFLKQCEAASKKEPCSFGDYKPHEGSFCMGCWRSPIRGPRYVCLICDDIEYCEYCEAKINHCHPLLKIKEPASTVQDFMDTLRTKIIQKNEEVFMGRQDVSFKEESVYKDVMNDDIDKSIGTSLDLAPYHELEDFTEHYKFEYKEISSAPLVIKSNKREWCVVYKTICLKNTGSTMWRKCHFEPVGLVPGTRTEVSYVAVSDTVLVTLEIHGFFAPGKYNSVWKVVHQGEMNELWEMGYIDLEFEVLENRGAMFGRQRFYEEGIEEDEFFDYC